MSSCCNKKGFKANLITLNRRKKAGYGRNLYRNTRDGWLGGVCAGLADHLCMDHWIMRLIFVASLMVLGPLTFWAYIALLILIGKKPKHSHAEREYDEDRQAFREKNIFKSARPAPERLRLAREKMDATLKRIEKMEHYVTSSRYDLDREFNKMEKGQ